MPRVLTPSQQEIAKQKAIVAEKADGSAAPKGKKQKKIVTESEEAMKAQMPTVGGKTYRQTITEMVKNHDPELSGLFVLSGRNEAGQLNWVEMPRFDFRISGGMAKEILGWETETDFIARKMRENQKLTADECRFENMTPKQQLAMPPWFWFGFGKEKVRVVCWNNDRNRLLDIKRCEYLAQVILQRGWAGPTTMESINGESGVIGETGQPLSCQHSLIGLLIAIDEWHKRDRWKNTWQEEPYIERLTVLGVSEAQQVVQTIDDVRPRTIQDRLFTGDEFRDLLFTPRQEISHMAEAALKFFWTRSQQAEIDRLGTKHSRDGGMEQYLTHPVMQGLLNRHPRLKKAVRFIFDLNNTGFRSISQLGLSAGQCATMLYLMATSTSEADDYRNADPPKESKLDFERWDAACGFWKRLAVIPEKGEAEIDPIRIALNGLKDPETGAGGNLLEKTCVLALAWQIICSGVQPSLEDLKLTRHVFPEDSPRYGEVVLVNRETFGGIDCCHAAPPDLSDETEEQIEAGKVAEKEAAAETRRQEAAAAMEAKVREVAAAKGTPQLGEKGENGKPKLGLPDVPATKPMTAKQIREANTAKAAAADADKSKLDGPAALDVERSKAKAVARKGLAQE